MKYLTRAVAEQFKRFSRVLTDPIVFQRKVGRATPVLVHQMGKVGSSSIYRSLKEQYAGVVAHSHAFSANQKRPLVRILHEHAVVNSQPLKVISLTREPIGRNVSAFFQNFETFTGVPYAKNQFSIEDLKDLFLKNFKHEVPSNWFDNHILANFGIDVFSTPFPETGIGRYQHENVELLVMRLEIDDADKIAAIQNFLELDRFELHNINLGQGKVYSQTYKEFSSHVTFPLEYLNQMCESKYFRHFYSEEKKQALITRWAEDVRDAA